MYLAALTGYMAKHGLHDPHEAHLGLTREVGDYYLGKAEKDGQSFDEFLEARIALKVRQYGSGLNDPAILDAIDEKLASAKAEAYRKASRGD
jgi:hypothetical protein